MKQIILILTFLILIFGCDNRKSELEFEKTVMQEIFPNLMDSLWVHNSTINTLPFVKLDKKGKVIGFEEKSKNDIRKSHKKTLQEIKRKNSKIFAVICDTIYPIGTNEKKSLKKKKKNKINQKKNEKKSITDNYKNEIIPKNKENENLKNPISIKKIIETKHIKIKFISKDTEERLWASDNNYNFNGVISFSRIQFDTKKKYGMLTSSIICGGMCGHGYRIFIKKVNNKWIVDKVEEAWIS